MTTLQAWLAWAATLWPKLWEALKAVGLVLAGKEYQRVLEQAKRSEKAADDVSIRLRIEQEAAALPDGVAGAELRAQATERRSKLRGAAANIDRPK